MGLGRSVLGPCSEKGSRDSDLRTRSSQLPVVLHMWSLGLWCELPAW